MIFGGVPGNHRRRFLAEEKVAAITEFIEPLAQRAFRGDALQPQRSAEELVATEFFDGLEVRLAQAQQADHRGEHVAVRNFRPSAFAQVNVVRPELDAGSLQQCARQGQPAMGNQDFVGLGNNEFHGLPFLTFKVNRDAHHHPHIHRKNKPFSRFVRQNVHGFRCSLMAVHRWFTLVGVASVHVRPTWSFQSESSPSQKWYAMSPSSLTQYLRRSRLKPARVQMRSYLFRSTDELYWQG